MIEDLREKLERILIHFVMVETVSGSNRVASEKIYNLIQARRYIQEKLTSGDRAIKYLFQMQYTNKLNFLAHLIAQKQNLYDIYRETE
jgi:hypothetical protein